LIALLRIRRGRQQVPPPQGREKHFTRRRGGKETGAGGGSGWKCLGSLAGVIPRSAHFGRLRDLAWTSMLLPRCARDPSLRLKNGFGRDDVPHRRESKAFDRKEREDKWVASGRQVTLGRGLRLRGKPDALKVPAGTRIGLRSLRQLGSKNAWSRFSSGKKRNSSCALDGISLPRAITSALQLRFSSLG
jgi:hypothetical protein